MKYIGINGVQSILTSSASSIASNGYLKLGNGLIIQWGSFTPTNGDTQFKISFNISFTTTNYYLNFISYAKKDEGRSDDWYIHHINTKDYSYAMVRDKNQPYINKTVDWFAIGY